MNKIVSHHRSTLNNLLKLHPSTTHAFTYFITGSLPAKAIIHQRQLGLFSMICHLPNDPLYKRAKYALTCLSQSHKSGFTQLRDICLLYDLPHPLELLASPISRESFKKLVRSKVISYWELKFREDVLSLTSLAFFKPAFHSLTRPHPILWTPGPNSYEVAKALVQCKMLSGRYRTEALASHWTQNLPGFCLTGSCKDIKEDLHHILLVCPSYQHIRDRLKQLWLQCTHPQLLPILCSVLEGPSQDLLQFILDASIHPEIITLRQTSADETLKVMFHLTRTCSWWTCEVIRMAYEQILACFILNTFIFPDIDIMLELSIVLKFSSGTYWGNFNRI